MESNWRWNVFDKIGATWCAWQLPVGSVPQLVYLCAELDPWLFFEGKWWTHILKAIEPPGNEVAELARGSDNVLTERSSFIFRYQPHFPYGYDVLPD